MSKSVMFKVQRHRASIYFDVSRPGGDYPGGKERQFRCFLPLGSYLLLPEGVK